MAILRKNRSGNFTTISNTALQDKELSYKAKGLLIYMWSLPDDWTFYETELANRSTDGLTSVRSGLKELQDKGYLVKKRVRLENGQLGENDWVLSDEPMENVDKKEFPPEAENQSLDNQSLGNQSLENHTLLNTNTTKDLNKLNTNNTNVRHKYGDNKNVLLTNDELEKLRNKFPNDWEKRINNLSYYIASKGIKYKSHYMTILNWARKDAQETTKRSDNGWEAQYAELF